MCPYVSRGMEGNLSVVEQRPDSLPCEDKTPDLPLKGTIPGSTVSTLAGPG